VSEMLPFGGDVPITPAADQWSIREFDGSPILVATIDGEGWSEVVGLCRLMDHTNPSKAVQDLVPPEHARKLNTSTAYFPSAGYGNGRGNPIKWFVSREGANRLLLDSRVPGARRLKAWLADDVLPSIEDTGSYGALGTVLFDPNDLDSLERLTQAATAAIAMVRQERVRAEVAEAKVAELLPLAEGYGHFMANGETCLFEEAAEALGVGHLLLGAYLRQHRYTKTDVYERTNGGTGYGPRHNKPYDAYTHWFYFKQYEPRRDGSPAVPEGKTQRRITKAGMDGLRRVLGRHLRECGTCSLCLDFKRNRPDLYDLIRSGVRRTLPAAG
jgi:prophage antirepressor-like protein